jgi:deoxyribodipyrimidine photo-lyase
LKHFIGHTLYHKEDLPFPINNIPDIFTSFRKKVERDGSVRPCHETPVTMSFPDNLEASVLPSLNALGFDENEPVDSRSVMQFEGGETEALQRMQDYFWGTNAVQSYKQTRNGLLGSDYSSKFSAWIALGCLSPREIYWEIKKYEQVHGSGDSTYSLYLELLWRDYFRFMLKKHGNKFFQKTGLKGLAPEECENQVEMFNLWKNGETGIPFIDADYDVQNWFSRAKGLENEPERGERCTKCFDMRFERTALYAFENNFKIITSSLGISRWKDMDQINDCGLRVAKKYEGINQIF